MDANSFARAYVSRWSLFNTRNANSSFRVFGGRSCLPGLHAKGEDENSLVTSSCGGGLQQQQYRSICNFVRRLEHARRKRRMVAAGATLFIDRKKASAYTSTPDPILALKECWTAKKGIAKDVALLNDIHRIRGGGRLNISPVQVLPSTEHGGRFPSSSSALEVERGVHKLKAAKTSTCSNGILRPLENVTLPSGRAACKQLHRIACMHSAKHMTAYLLVFSKTAIRPADTSGYMAVLRRLAEDANSLDSRSLWRACAAVRNFRKARECSWTVQETATPEQCISAEFQESKPTDVFQNLRASERGEATARQAQLQKLASDGEEAVIDALIRAAAALLQQQVDLRVASRLLSCFALDFNVFYLPFYAHASLNFIRQSLRASAEELAQTAFAFASLQLRDSYLFEKIAEAARSILSCFAIAQLSRLLLSFALLEIQCSSLLVAAAPHLERLAPHCCAEEIGRIAFTHARAGLCPPPVRRLLAARVPTALAALTEPSQVADLLVSARRLQLQLPLSLQVHTAERLHLNDLDGQSFAAVLLAVLPLRSLSPIFWQDAAASCLLRVLLSTPALERKALLLRALGKTISDEEHYPTDHEAPLLQSYSKSLHALPAPAIVDCFVCFATIFGASPVDAGCGAGVASTEQHNRIAVILAGLSHALCSSRRGNVGCREVNVGHSGNSDYSYAPIIDTLQPTDVVRMYRALRRMRSSWDVERQRRRFECEAQKTPRSRSGEHSYRICAATALTENAARSDSSSVNRRHSVDRENEPQKRKSAATSEAVQRMRWIDEEVAAMPLEDGVHFSMEAAQLSQRLRHNLAAHVSEEHSVICRRSENSPLHVDKGMMGIADAPRRRTISEDQSVAVDIAEWVASIVASAQRYSARVLDQRDSRGRDTVELPLLHAEDMAAALVCSYTQRQVWHSLERALLRRFLLMLHSDAFSVPDILSCAYSVFCLYPYAKNRLAPFRGPQLNHSRTRGRCRGITGAPPHPASVCASSSRLATPEVSLSEAVRHPHEAGDCSPGHRREEDTYVQATLAASTRETKGAAAPPVVPAAASATESVPSTPFNAVAGDLPESSVLAVVCQRAAAALRNAYLRAQQDEARRERQPHLRGSTPQSAAGERAVLEALNTLEPYQQHALCSLITEYAPSMPSFLLKALPRLSAAPLQAGRGGGHRIFSNNSWPSSVSLLHPKSQVSFTSPTVGAELERVLQLAGISVQVYLSTGLYTFLAAETNRPIAYLYFSPDCFQRMHSTAATVSSCLSADYNSSPLQHFTNQCEETQRPSSRCQRSPLLSGKPSSLTRAQVFHRAALQLNAHGIDIVEAAAEVTVNCAPSIAASTGEIPSSLMATKQIAASPADTPLPHVASGGDGLPYVLKSDVGATLRLLQAEGWQVVSVPFCMWRLLGDEKEKLRFLLEQRRHLLYDSEGEASGESSLAAFPGKCSAER